MNIASKPAVTTMCCLTALTCYAEVQHINSPLCVCGSNRASNSSVTE